uniref:Uncharacterized protein n=1 Tax=Nelumbo nucifera TaxID=4432 RepID=A0A823A119_NELNU|nr:TPA_asm: hypothetical protein HUJ06_018946 [Nelumbo nucifera]
MSENTNPSLKLWKRSLALKKSISAWCWIWQGSMDGSKDLYRNMLRCRRSQESPFISGALDNFIAGAAAGCTTLVIIYPLEIAHTRLAADIGDNRGSSIQGHHSLTGYHSQEKWYQGNLQRPPCFSTWDDCPPWPLLWGV